MVILEFKLKGTSRQYQALDEAIRTTQFIRLLATKQVRVKTS